MTTTTMLDNLPSKKQLSCLKLAVAKRSHNKGLSYCWECPDCWVSGDTEHQLRFYFDGDPRVSSPLAHDPKRLSAGAAGLSLGETADDIPQVLSDRPVASTTGEPVFYPVGEVLSGLRHCVLACDTNSTRYVLGGVLIEANRVAATDGRRLHWADIATGEAGALDKNQVILPIAAVKLLIALLPDCRPADSVVVQISDNEVTFLGSTKSGASWKYVARRMEGRFPRIDDVISFCETPNKSHGTADYHSDLARAAKIFDEERAGAEIGDGRFAYLGVDGEFFPGVPNMLLDISFLRDALENMRGDVVIGYSDPVHAVRMDNGEFHAILMPMANK